MLVVGVDGCRDGWVAVALEGGRLEGAAARTLRELLARWPGAAVYGVDMPIGLPDLTTFPREADRAARRALGRRASSVFLVPPLAVLKAESYAEARNVCRELGLASIVSAQAFALKDKIREADDLAAGEPRLHEVHPEVAFLELARSLDRAAPALPKSHWDGHQERRELLAAAGLRVDGLRFGAVGSHPGPDDVLDAAVVAWSAARIARGEARCYPEEPPRDGRGRVVGIWC